MRTQSISIGADSSVQTIEALLPAMAMSSAAATFEDISSHSSVDFDASTTSAVGKISSDAGSSDAVVNASKDGEGFPSFSKLPKEIRIMIWGFARKPRIIEARYYHFRSNKEGTSPRFDFSSNNVVPPALAVSRDVRAEESRHYQTVQDSNGGEVYFNPADILYLTYKYPFPRSFLLNISESSECDSFNHCNVQQVAIDIALSIAIRPQQFGRLTATLVKAFPHMKTFIMVFLGDRENQVQLSWFVDNATFLESWKRFFPKGTEILVKRYDGVKNEGGMVFGRLPTQDYEKVRQRLLK